MIKLKLKLKRAKMNILKISGGNCPPSPPPPPPPYVAPPLLRAIHETHLFCTVTNLLILINRLKKPYHQNS